MILSIVFLTGTIIGLCVSLWMVYMYCAFSYNGKRQMSRQIIEGMNCYTREQLKDALRAAGFSKIKMRHHSKTPWISVLAGK